MSCSPLNISLELELLKNELSEFDNSPIILSFKTYSIFLFIPKIDSDSARCCLFTTIWIRFRPEPHFVDLVEQ